MAAENFCRSILSLGKYLPVLLVLILIGWSYYAFVFRLCIHYEFNENITQVPIAIEYYSVHHEDEFIPSIDLNISFLILGGGVFSIGLFGFLIYHTNLILHNRTTLESLKHYKITHDVEEGDRDDSGRDENMLNIFDIDEYISDEDIFTMNNFENNFDRANFIQVMGPTWYLWFFPIKNSLGDGKTWPVNYEKYNELYGSRTS
ncbi:2341_t:CDS:2 [Diversispora eburnea]|uniref:2341_t:CDS:1 n=1 Tax=Diversispora eburnea TaxID=1213867 RepID=A0A9N8V7A7_9GLOM|nr:2341_t:CDS:2 [Diversispora eburnea]